MNGPDFQYDGLTAFAPITRAATPNKKGLMSAADKAKLDLMGAGAGIFYGVRARNSANISVAGSSQVALTFNSNTFSQVNDGSTPHSTASNTSRFVATKAGWWEATASVEFAASAAGTQRFVGIRRAGTTYLAINGSPPQGGTFSTFLAVAAAYQFAANDYVEVVVFQDSGGALNVLASAEYSPAVTWAFIGN